MQRAVVDRNDPTLCRRCWGPRDCSKVLCLACRDNATARQRRFKERHSAGALAPVASPVVDEDPDRTVFPEMDAEVFAIKLAKWEAARDLKIHESGE